MATKINNDNKQELDQFLDVEADAIEVSEEDLGNVSGGVQAGLFTIGGKGEFGTGGTEEETEKTGQEKLRDLTGKPYL